jgi:hypothetical protein
MPAFNWTLNLYYKIKETKVRRTKMLVFPMVTGGKTIRFIQKDYINASISG